MSVEVLPATSERFADVESALTGGGDGADCQCQWWMLRNADFARTPLPERERMLRTELAAPRSPGFVAYVDDAAAGWVRVGPRTDQKRLAHTRAVAGFSPEPLDDPDVWAVTCFSVRKEYRRHGLMAALLDAAIAHARENGARVLEAYPLDPRVKKFPANELYRGVVAVFEDAGFEVVARPRPERPIMSLALRA